MTADAPQELHSLPDVAELRDQVRRLAQQVHGLHTLVAQLRAEVLAVRVPQRETD